MLAFVAAVVLAVAPPLTPVSPRLINVSGQSKLAFPANQALAVVAVTSRDRDLKSATRGSDDKVRKLLDAVRSAGLEDREVQVNPPAPNPDYRGSEVIAYDVTRQVTLTVSDLKKLDTILNAALKAGATMHGSISFSNTTQATYELKARTAAAAAAKEKATAMVEALGGKLGLPRTVGDSTPNGTAGAVRYVVPAADGTVTTHATEVELSVTALVSVQFDIRDEG
jgi:uncharacterized protein YggE